MDSALVNLLLGSLLGTFAYFIVTGKTLTLTYVVVLTICAFVTYCLLLPFFP